MNSRNHNGNAHKEVAATANKTPSIDKHSALALPTIQIQLEDLGKWEALADGSFGMVSFTAIVQTP
jgi:hypothetical protein